MSRDLSSLPRMIAYYGSKWRISKRYSQPLHDTIIEPFAGGAGYSLHHYQRNIILCDTDEIVCAVWGYLIRSTRESILRLPLLAQGQSVDELNICQEAKWLIGFWVNNAICRPRKTLSRWAVEDIKKSNGKCVNFWSEGCRERLAKSVGKISHWEVRCADYREIEDVEATWFIDPPYIGMGHHYHSDELDYETLASWCKSRRGQVIVCELSGASWLPFVPFIETVNASKKNRKEVIWQRA